jgi:tRNA-splicing ligase RtcB
MTASGVREIFRTENDFGSGEVRSWASLLDESCRRQAEAISRVPVLDGYLALMPDAHHGFGPPVGSALLTRDAVMPYAVGVDIGCGMIAVETGLTRDAFRGKEGRLLGSIRELVPSGVGRGHTLPPAEGRAFLEAHGPPPGAHLTREGLAEVAVNQFGTLGSGNHFVEVCTEADETVWFVLHSGSRGVGNQLATAHVRRAKELCDAALESPEFAFFRADQPEYAAYLADMLWCQAYAFEQRESMMRALIRAVEEQVGAVEVRRKVNCHHNYAEEVEPGLWLTRKGAIDASEGRMGVIPGSMGAATYIVRGKGNAESYNTSPHGAGRMLGRNAARKSLSIEEFRAQMAGKTWLDRDAAQLLDEAPFAYKPIEVVIADSADLIEPVTVLSQFINYKGL